MGARGRTAALLGLAIGGALILLASPGILATGDRPSEAPAESYIVQGHYLEDAAAAVKAVGGEVTHELGIIGAVGARLTPAQRAEIERAPGVRRVWADREARVATAGNVLDRFDVTSFANNDGSSSWAAVWQENDPAGGAGPGSGEVQVTGSELRFNNASGSENQWVRREADVSGFTTAILSFDYRASALAHSWYEVAVEVYYNGDWYVMLEQFAVPSQASGSRAYDISAYISADTEVRIRIPFGFYGASEYFYVDNVQIADSIVPPPPLVTSTIMARVSTDNDDAEERLSNGSMYLDSSDLELVDDGSTAQRVGIRFRDLSIPQGATITSAKIELETDETDNGATSLTVRAQAADDAPAFSSSAYDLSSRPTTAAVASWNPGAWTTVSQKHLTSDLSAVVQEVIDRPGWVSGNSMVFVVSGTGERTAESHDGESANAPLIAISYEMTPDTDIPTLIGADQLHAQGIDGSGVTVAVVDTGYWPHPGLDKKANGQSRVLAQYDAMADQMDAVETDTDGSGHATHVNSLMLSSAITNGGKYNGVAPGADLVSIKAFDGTGAGSYLDVIRGIDFAVANKAAYGIKVLNLSFSAEPLSWYWDDPLNQAVMAAWQAGIVVVASAGNGGPLPMSIGVPGNVPYVLTPGAMSDGLTPADGSDDYLASWSSAGPTLEAFVKPDLVAPGGHALGLMPGDSSIALAHPEFLHGGKYFTMSGTSQAAAVTSGVVALMLDNDPTLTPDDVKCKLMDSGRAAVDGAGNLAYSPLQQGAGLIDAAGAVASTRTGCANLGLDIAADLAGTEHYAGPVRWDDPSETFYVDGVGYHWDASFPMQGFSWTAATPWVMATPWVTATPWVMATPWVTATPWVMATPWVTATPWVMATPWVTGIPWDSNPHAWTGGLTETMSINVWVPQE